MQELAEIEQGQELTTLTSGLPDFIKLIKSKVDYKNIDIDSKKGRDEIVSNAFKVTKTKTAISKQIDALINSKKEEIAPTLKIIDSLKSSKKTTNSELSELSKTVRQVVTDWELEEQKRIDLEKERLEAEAIKKEKDSDETSAIVEDELFNMKLEKRLDEEKRLEGERIERLRIEQQARDQRIADEAAAKATADAQSAKDQAIQDKLQAEESAKQAEINRLASEKAAELAAIQAGKDAAEAKIQAQKLAESAAESARLAEVKRQQEERDAEEERFRKIKANKSHVGNVRREIKERFMKVGGIDEAAAKAIVKEIIMMSDRLTIHY